MSSAAQPTTLNRWQRRRDRTRNALATAALKLFRTRGYDATTVDQIADAADVSPRTFFHHFATKEEVLFGGHEERRRDVISTLEERLETAPVWEAISGAMMTVVAAFETDPVFFRERAKLYAREPGLRAAVLSINDKLVNDMAEVIAAKMGCRPDDLTPRLIATLANGAMRSAIDSWVSSRADADLRAMAIEALRIARPALREAAKANSNTKLVRRRSRIRGIA